MRKSKWMFFLKIFIIVLLGVLVILYFENFKLEKLIIEGGSHYTQKEIEDYLVTSKADGFTHFFYLKYNVFGSPEPLPFVEKMDFEIVDKNTIHVQVYDKMICGCVEHMGAFMHFDRDGIVVESTEQPDEGVALFATEDSASGTLKNIYAKGYTRSQVYFSKYVVSLIAVLIMSAVTVVFAYGYSNSIWGNDLEIADNVSAIFIGQLLGIAAYHAIFFAISTIFGKVGSAIALNIIGPMAVSLVFGLGDAFIKSENTKLTSYWVDSLYSNFTASVSNQNILTTGIVLFAIYIGAAIFIGLFMNRKKEI